MLPKILRNFNVFVDGRGYAGKIDEITLPKLTIKAEAVVLKVNRKMKNTENNFHLF